MRRHLDARRPGGAGARDDDLFAVVESCKGETAIQLRWLLTRMKQAAPQVLVVAR